MSDQILKETLAKNVNKMRNDMHLTQTQVGMVCGYSNEAVAKTWCSNLEHAKGINIYLEQFIQLMKLFNVNMETLLEGYPDLPGLDPMLLDSPEFRETVGYISILNESGLSKLNEYLKDITRIDDYKK